MATTSTAVGGRRWTSERVLIVGGLITGVVFGQAGNWVEGVHLQDLLHALSSIGMVMASVLLVLREVRRGGDLVAAGFAILAIAEIVQWAGGPSGPGGEAAFVASVLFYVPALLLISLPPRFAFWARAAGALAAVPFGIHAGVYLSGGNPAEGLQIAGYMLLTVAIIGWVVGVARSSESTDDGRRGEAPVAVEQHGGVEPKPPGD